MIGDRLRGLREAQELSQHALGKEIGVSQSHICEIEAGVKRPGIGLLERLAAYFNVPVGYFFADDPTHDEQAAAGE